MKRTRCLLICAFVLNFLGLVHFVIGFSTNHWLEADSKYRVTTGFQKLGLWEACFKDYSPRNNLRGKTYNGCWWMFSYEYEPIREWLNPPWFLAIQVLLVIALVLQLVADILNILFVLNVCQRHGATSYLALLSVSAMTFTSGLICAVCLIMFGIKSDESDAGWLENPEKNFLSWSFGVVAASGFFSLFGAMCVLVAAMQVRLEQKYGDRSQYDGHVLQPQPTMY